MQLFIPSVITIVIIAVLAFLVIPRTGSLILASVSLLALIAVGFHHYNLFYSEYMMSTWQNGIGANAPFIVLALAIVFIISSILFMFQGGEAKGAAINSIQEALAAPMETLSQSMENVINTKSSNILPNVSGATDFFNRGITAVNNAANTMVNNVTKFNNQSKVSPVIPGLGFRASEV